MQHPPANYNAAHISCPYLAHIAYIPLHIRQRPRTRRVTRNTQERGRRIRLYVLAPNTVQCTRINRIDLAGRRDAKLTVAISALEQHASCRLTAIEEHFDNIAVEEHLHRRTSVMPLSKSTSSTAVPLATGRVTPSVRCSSSSVGLPSCGLTPFASTMMASASSARCTFA